MATETTTAPPFGTLAWAQRGGGRMSRAEIVRESLVATRELVSLLLARSPVRRGLASRAAAALDPDDLDIPDSALARDAEAECRDSVSPMLYNHSVRTYVWGVVLARLDRVEFDAELLYVASMLHDLTLGDRYRDYAPMPCFAARGGLLAEDWGAARGMAPDRRRAVADAISQHLNLRLDPARPAEARLLHAGAAVEIIGVRYQDLAPATVDAVLARYPRLGLKQDGPALFAAEGHPGTRTRFLNRRGFGTLLRRSPFPE